MQIFASFPEQGKQSATGAWTAKKAWSDASSSNNKTNYGDIKTKQGQKEKDWSSSVYWGQLPKTEKIPMEMEKRINKLEQKINKLETRNVNVIKINFLRTLGLREPMDAIIEPDNKGFIARAVDFPLYGYGDDCLESIDALKCEIESLYNDLMEDNNFSKEWLRIKDFLKAKIIV
jgi:hypothetical protein